MSYYEKMEESIKRMKEFDANISVNVSALKDSVEKIDFNGMVASDDNKQVTAHKNRVLRVVNRVIDKFNKEIEQYLIPLINNDVSNDETQENEKLESKED